MTLTFQTSRAYPGIPTPKKIELPILHHVADGGRYEFGDIYAAMVAHFDLTRRQEEHAFRHVGGVNWPPSGSNVFYKYCNNTCNNLITKGWLVGEGEHGGQARYYEDRNYRITDAGLRQVT